MKILVDKLPGTPRQCYFSKRSKIFNKYECCFNKMGVVHFCDDVSKCKYLKVVKNMEL